MWDDLATDRQMSYIMRLLDARAVTRRTAERIIAMLEDCTEINGDGMDLSHIKREYHEQQRAAARGGCEGSGEA